MGTVKSPHLARMAGHRVYIDTNVFIYFLQRDEVFFPIAAEILKACVEGTILGVTGDLAVAEVMVHPYRSGDATLIARCKQFFRQKDFLTVLPHDSRLFDEAAMIAGQRRLKLIDAIHYHTALQNGCRFLITHDKRLSIADPDAPLQPVYLADLIAG